MARNQNHASKNTELHSKSLSYSSELAYLFNVTFEGDDGAEICEFSNLYKISKAAKHI